jgi:hypothetical protein
MGMAAYRGREAERLTLLADPVSRDVLSRTTVVTEAAESRVIVQRLLANGMSSSLWC